MERLSEKNVVLVTGGAGFIGSNFIRGWLGKYPKDTVINFDSLTYAGNLTNLTDVVDHDPKRYKFVRGDITDKKAVAAVMATYCPDVVVNFAAESHNSRAIVDPGIFFETNVLGTQRLLDAALRVPVRLFHHVSTCEVYGDMSLTDEIPFSEETPYHPNTPYNASKAAADMAVRAYSETYKLPTTVSRCSNNYGPYQFPEKVIPHFVTSVLRGKQMTLYKQSRNRREWLHVDDHCQAIDLIIHQGDAGEVYNVGSGVEADIETIADLIIQELGVDVSYKTYVDDRPSHDRRYFLDSSKIRDRLGWKPEIDFAEGLRKTIKWYTGHQDWWEPLLHKQLVQEELWSHQK